MKSYNRKGSKSITKSVKGIRALHEGDTFTYYMTKYGLKHGALAHTKQQAIRGSKMTNVKQFKQENLLSNL